MIAIKYLHIELPKQNEYSAYFYVQKEKYKAKEVLFIFSIIIFHYLFATVTSKALFTHNDEPVTLSMTYVSYGNVEN